MKTPDCRLPTVRLSGGAAHQPRTIFRCRTLRNDRGRVVRHRRQAQRKGPGLSNRVEGSGPRLFFHMINDGARLRSSAATRNTLLLSAGSGKPAASSLCHFFLWRLARIRFLRLCLLILRFRVFRPQGNYSFLREPLLPTKCSHQSDCGNTHLTSCIL